MCSLLSIYIDFMYISLRIFIFIAVRKMCDAISILHGVYCGVRELLWVGHVPTQWLNNLAITQFNLVVNPNVCPYLLRRLMYSFSDLHDVNEFLLN